MQLIHKISALCACLFVSACAHQPPVVYSSQPLVSKTQNDSLVLPQSYWDVLDNLGTGQTIILNNKSVYVEARYISGLGQNCIKLRITEAQNLKRIVCKEPTSEWKIVPDIVLEREKSALFNVEVSNAK